MGLDRGQGALKLKTARTEVARHCPRSICVFRSPQVAPCPVEPFNLSFFSPSDGEVGL